MNDKLYDYGIQRKQLLKEVHEAKIEALEEIKEVARNLRISLNLLDEKLSENKWIKERIYTIDDRLTDIEMNTRCLKEIRIHQDNKKKEERQSF